MLLVLFKTPILIPYSNWLIIWTIPRSILNRLLYRWSKHRKDPVPNHSTMTENVRSVLDGKGKAILRRKVLWLGQEEHMMIKFVCFLVRFPTKAKIWVRLDEWEYLLSVYLSVRRSWITIFMHPESCGIKMVQDKRPALTDNIWEMEVDQRTSSCALR
jgi:hypothetical protein